MRELSVQSHPYWLKRPCKYLSPPRQRHVRLNHHYDPTFSQVGRSWITFSASSNAFVTLLSWMKEAERLLQRDRSGSNVRTFWPSYLPDNEAS